MVYHSTNLKQFSQYIGTDGTCTESKTTDPACTQNLLPDGTLTTYYDTTTEKVVMKVEIPDTSYAGWGWGSTMKNTEMLIFSANGA